MIGHGIKNVTMPSSGALQCFCHNTDPSNTPAKQNALCLYIYGETSQDYYFIGENLSHGIIESRNEFG